MKLSGDVVRGEDLLHEILAEFLAKDKEWQERIACRENVRKYITSAIYNELRRQNGRYNKTYNRIYSLVFLSNGSYDAEPDTPDDADQINGEKIFSLINSLSLHDAALLRLYAMPDFSYERMAEETGIPVYYLHKRINRAKEKLRKYAIQL